jgi:F-type H+-transporting ATPase subunit epsilon
MSLDLPTTLKLKVISPSELLVDEEVQEVFLPSLEGLLGIYPGHRPLFVALGQGTLTYKRVGKETQLPVQGGIAEVLPDRVLVFIKQDKDENDQPSEEHG